MSETFHFKFRVMPLCLHPLYMQCNNGKYGRINDSDNEESTKECITASGGY